MQAGAGCVREARGSARGDFRRTRFGPADAEELAAFHNWLRIHHWTLTSLAYAREPARKPVVRAEDLSLGDRAHDRVGTFLLKRAGAIIACVTVDEKMDCDQRSAVFSGAETHPDYQRRGTFWRWLGMPLIRAFCRGGFDRLEAVTWALNRKGIPIYERCGFRRIPGTGVNMVSYLPVVVRHPEVRKVLGVGDFLRHLKREGGPGERGRLVYRWALAAGELVVVVDVASGCVVRATTTTE